MLAKDLLLTRQSTPVLTSPAPTDESLDFILQAGMRVPDHGGLTPWHFTVVKDEGLNKLGEIYKAASILANKTEVMVEKASKMPFRAPLIIVVSTDYKSNDKIPLSEQSIAAGCSVHAMQMAAFSAGFGAIWRTGDLSYNEDVKSALSICPHNDIVGFLYIGSLNKEAKVKPAKSYLQHVSYL